MAEPPFPPLQIVVVGAGVIGLTAALELRSRGHAVTVLTRDELAATTSAVAAAIWYPFLAEPRARVLPWAAATFRVLQRLARDPATGVRMQPVVEGFATATPDLWWASAGPRVEKLAAAEVPPPFQSAIRVEVPLCDTTRYLPWLAGALEKRGGRIEHRELQSLDEAFALAPVIVNCTGLGARRLCKDRDLHAVRGQVLVLDRAALPHAFLDETGARPIYVLPRGGDVVLGGSATAHDERLEVDDGDSQAILAACRRHFPQLEALPVRAVKVGLRPCRSTVRCERHDRPDGGVLVHDYGHGGSGFTLAWGCAQTVAALIEQDPEPT
jgi:D-amino-acid oxidase